MEHRLFSYISRNWEGKPLRSLEIMLGYIRGTRTETGLQVTGYLDEDFYKRSIPYSHKDVDQLSLEAHEVCPQWNYTITPRGSRFPGNQQPPVRSPASRDRDQRAVTSSRLKLDA